MGTRLKKNTVVIELQDDRKVQRREYGLLSGVALELDIKFREKGHFMLEGEL